FQPEWAADGKLYFVWDKSGWGALYVWDGKTVTGVAEAQSELMRPQWLFGMQSYVLLDETRAVAAFIERGETRLALIDLASGEMTPVESDMRSVDALAPFDDRVAVIGATDIAAPAVVSLDLGGKAHIVRSSGETGLAGGDISKGEMLCFAGEDGEVFALFYPPANASCSAPANERPPVIILVHGGPTGMAGRGLNLKIQYWTSRGFAICDLDYSGTAGYGRAYRERLAGQWGLRDVADVSALARTLGKSGRVDTNRVLISGGSAGGYTVLMALAALDIFAAGACAYGVADLAQLQRVTHKFESGYLYALTGTNEQTCDAVFAARSPIALAHEINCPVIFFQGLEDKVVPPEQSRAMAQTLRERGVPVAYSEFANEGHGFRRAATIVKVLESEYAFYARVLGLEPAEALPEVAIENWR
ncbi:MAG: S9 family peptidase, partial [Proteobacteria bacterium]|nr:S9 family peptidase [Pseudomonadota bacterium]